MNDPAVAHGLPEGRWTAGDQPSKSGPMSDDLTEAELDAILTRARRACGALGIDRRWSGPLLGGDNFIRAGGLDDETPDIYVTLSY